MLSRRTALSVLGALPAAGSATPGRLYAQASSTFPRRLLGRTVRMVVPLALGGQASLQWTSPGIDAPDIVVRAIQLGVNYLDSANAYGPSQANYGEAFRRLHLSLSGLLWLQLRVAAGPVRGHQDGTPVCRGSRRFRSLGSR